MAETFHYRSNRKGWDAIALGPEMQKLTSEVAEKAKAHARSIAPESNDGRGVPYKDSFDVEQIVVKEFGRGVRAGARLINTAQHAAAVEWGNKRTKGQGHRVLGRTLDFLGSSS